MRILIWMFLLFYVEAANKTQSYKSGRSRIVVESFSKEFFNYFKLSFVYHNRTSYMTKIDVDLLKTIELERMWLDVSFYHSRNNQYNMIPIGRGISGKKFLEDDSFGIGSSLKKYVSFPMRPKKYLILISNINMDKNTYQVPVFGDYKICNKIKDIDISIFTICWMGTIKEVDKTKNK